MCALHPSLRNDWARTWNKVMKSGGYLIALEYPIRPDDKTGPPWPVSPQIYADLLIPLGETSSVPERNQVDLQALSAERSKAGILSPLGAAAGAVYVSQSQSMLCLYTTRIHISRRPLCLNLTS